MEEDVRLMLGDCLERMSEIADQSVDLVLCDLPYGTTACAWDSVIPFEPLWAHYWRVCRGAVVLTASQPFTSALIQSNIKNFKHEWIWNKVYGANFGTVKWGPLKIHENIAVFANKKFVYNPIKVEGKPNHGRGTSYKRKDGFFLSQSIARMSEVDDSNLKHPKSVQTFEKHSSQSREHPTQKPVALMEYMIRTYTNPSATVLDNCMGSGTTGVAALSCGRRFIGIEKDPTYFDVAERRIRSCDAYQMLYG